MYMGVGLDHSRDVEVTVSSVQLIFPFHLYTGSVDPTWVTRLVWQAPLPMKLWVWSPVPPCLAYS